MKKVLIVTVPLGGGHIATANALYADLKALYPELEVELVDIFKDIKVVIPVEKFTVPAYTYGVRLFKSYPYKWFFKFSNEQAELLNKLILTLGKDRLPKYLKKKDPDVIISTYPINSAITQALKSWPKHVPVISVVTDTGDVHRIWLMGNEDALLVPTQETWDFAVRNGMPKDKVHYLGFPVARQFRSMLSTTKARKKLGLANKPTVLISGGGLGLNNQVLEIARRLSKLPNLEAQLVFVAGKNPSLVRELKALRFACDTTIFGFVSNMPDLMAASDFVVGKAGWISVYEAMVARKPNIIIDVVPGQEEPNAEFVDQHGIGMVVRDPRIAVHEIEQHLRSPDRLAAYAKYFDKLGIDSHAGERIAKFIVDNFVEAK